ncbi:MAG: amidinotransferase, partial [Chitinophagia bacterium]|nr:amidinotransferase [Chitinophagia bacterium]
MQQVTKNIMLVRPANFGFNEETAVSNAFQNKPGEGAAADLNARAQAEFDNFVTTLRSYGVHAIVVNDTEAPVKPDAIFPNNWVT